MTDSERKSHIINILRDVSKNGANNGRSYIESMADKIMSVFAVITVISTPEPIAAIPVVDEQQNKGKNNK